MASLKKYLKWAAYVGFAMLCGFCLLLLPCVQRTSDTEGWRASQFSVRYVAVALQAYHDTFKKLPPAVVTDKEGNPLYSWRVLLLPFLEEDKVYKQLKLDEPWDSEHNRKLLEQTPRAYEPLWGAMGPDPPGTTRYQVLVGPGTPFERPGITWADFRGGLADILLVVEAGRPVPWSKPEDVVYDPQGPLPPLGGAFSQPVHILCYEVGRRPGFNAGFADGTARFIRSDTDEKTIRGLITRNGGEQVDLSRLD